VLMGVGQGDALALSETAAELAAHVCRRLGGFYTWALAENGRPGRHGMGRHRVGQEHGAWQGTSRRRRGPPGGAGHAAASSRVRRRRRPLQEAAAACPLRSWAERASRPAAHTQSATWAAHSRSVTPGHSRHSATVGHAPCPSRPLPFPAPTASSPLPPPAAPGRGVQRQQGSLQGR
jgi:hypothetical protein